MNKGKAPYIYDAKRATSRETYTNKHISTLAHDRYNLKFDLMREIHRKPLIY